MKEMGHADIKTTMIYVLPGKGHIGEQVKKLNGISLPRSPRPMLLNSHLTSAIFRFSPALLLL